MGICENTSLPNHLDFMNLPTEDKKLDKRNLTANFADSLCLDSEQKTGKKLILQTHDA